VVKGRIRPRPGCAFSRCQGSVIPPRVAISARVPRAAAAAVVALDDGASPVRTICRPLGGREAHDGVARNGVETAAVVDSKRGEVA
jgi:hypothetical protein